MYPDKEFDIKKLQGDASTRSYSRLTFKEPSHKPSTLILMEKGEPLNEEEDDFLRIREYLHSCKIPVPLLYSVDAKKGLLYLQDCGDILLEEIITKSEPSKIERHYSAVLDILVTMQTECTRRLTREKPVSNVVTSRSFDMAKYMFELNHTAKWFIKGHLKKSLTKKDEKRLGLFFEKLVTPLVDEPMIFTHRDFHSRNIMVENGRYYILDFQDAMMGPMQYDLASLLFDSYVKIEEKVRKGLIDYYLGRRGIVDADETEKFYKTLYRVALQRNLKALGTFGYQAVERGNSSYLKYVPTTIDYIGTNIYKVSDIEEESEWVLSLLN